jgi:3-methyladenine DNA glycosylase AlkD
LVAAVRSDLRAVAEPARAAGMQAYMKSAMPYLGVTAPAARVAFAAVFAAHPLPDRASWEATVRALWDGAEYREERYAAVALTGHRRYRDHQDPGTLPLYRELIRSGAWWDYVDEIASRRVGPILRAYPDAVRPVVVAWSAAAADDADLWLRRTSIICQLAFKGETDLALLAACIEANLDDRDFFIRKAIGWALRQYARTDPAWVRRYAEQHTDRLAGLSRREALKHLG